MIYHLLSVSDLLCTLYSTHLNRRYGFSIDDWRYQNGGNLTSCSHILHVCSWTLYWYTNDMEIQITSHHITLKFCNQLESVGRGMCWETSLTKCYPLRNNRATITSFIVLGLTLGLGPGRDAKLIFTNGGSYIQHLQLPLRLSTTTVQYQI